MFECLKLQDRQRASQWCESHLIFPRGTSPNQPGPVSFDRQPYLREIIDTVLDPTVENVYFAGGSQIGKSAALICMLGALIGLEPSDGIWAMKSLDQVRDFSRKRLMDYIRQNPSLSCHLKPDSTAFSPLSYELDNMNVTFIGTGSPANMASRSVAWVIADEAAKYEWVNKEESTPIQLLQERTKAFPRRFHVFASTPTTTENEFWQGFIATDMREYFVPCPYCEKPFVLRFTPEMVKWDKPEDGITDIDMAESTTRVICPHCARDIYDDQKQSMMARGTWQPSEHLRKEYGDDRIAPSKKSRGYHISTMYSPYQTWGKYTRKFLECLQKLTVATDLQNLKNSWEALPYEFTKITVKNEQITALCGDYPRGICPIADPYYLSVGYDPGGDATHWVACAIGEGGAIYVIDWGTILQFRTESHLENRGTPENPDWQTVIDKPGIAPHFATLQFGEHKPSIGFVDAGYMTEDIYNECLMQQGTLTPTKGSPAHFGTWYTRSCGPKWGSQHVLVYVDFFAKRALYEDRIARRRGPVLVLPRAEDVDHDLIKGLSGQKLVEKGNITEWRRVPDDHYGDALKIQLVGTWALLDRFEESPTVPQQETAL